MPNKPSEGEKIIQMFLDEEGIKYKPEEEIYGLKNDYEHHLRRADLYLPRYKVYVEFFGQWNVDREKPRYKEKKAVYKDNKIPCVYIYPENLGTLKYLFYMRLKKELETHNMKKEMHKYKFDIFKKVTKWIWLGFYLAILTIIILTTFAKIDMNLTPLASILIVTCFLITIGLNIYIYKKLFKK